MKEKFKCLICQIRFNDTKNIPRLLPCNNSICESCVTTHLDLKKKPKTTAKTSTDIEFTFNCTFCFKTHDIAFTTKEKTTSNLPLDETTLHQMRRSSIESKHQPKDEESTQFISQTNNGHRKMSLVLEDVNANTNELNLNIKSSKEKLLKNFSQIETEINARTDKLIGELKESRERLIKELNESKENAMSRLEEAIDTYSSIKTFQNEYQKMCIKLNEKAMPDTELDKKELRNIALLAEDLNQKIEKTNFVIKKMTEKPYFKFIKPATVINTDKLIGKLQTDFDSKLFSKITPIKSENEQNVASKNSMISYKISSNAINVIINVINDKTVLKITELTENSNDYNHLISLQCLSAVNGNILSRHTESIGMQRVKKAYMNQKYLAILLVNQYLGTYNTLQLYEVTSEFKLTQSIDLEYRPVDVYLNENAVYVTSNKSHGFIHKYNFELKHLKSFGQSSKDKESFYIPKYFKLECVIQEHGGNGDHQKIYFVDYENLKIRIMNETNGKYVKKVNINVNQQSLGGNGSGAGVFGKNILLQIDAHSQRIFILNKKMFRMAVLNWDGMLISQKEIDSNVQGIDKFYLIGENAFSVVDYENQLVHFF